ncbi:MAG: tyrosine-type recombinase/integrase [Phycisphaeraceae bacterium]|nr:tyrosine-type recombinase/integrase [Phycisphaerales bacterium]MCB9843652.1 tyrosine-type recombinase/integrase [Phycisphaeraceae bacterium]
MHYTREQHAGGSTRNTKKTTLPIEVLTEDEARRLMDACGARSPTGLRNRALIALLYRAGLRVSEALALYPKDIDLQRGIVRVLRGKNGYARTVGIDPAACAVIARWVEARRRMSRGVDWKTVPLLCTTRGGAVSASYVRVLLPRLGMKAGIAKRVHAHGLRHTMAAELRAEGVDIAVISRQLGHRSITTTARYLDHIMPTAVIDAMRGRGW